MLNKKNILVFPCESENSFEIFNSLKYSTRFSVYGASNKEGHGSYIFSNYFPCLPGINQKNFIEELNLFIQREKIEFIIPTHDDVAFYLSKHTDSIAAKIIGSCAETANICRHKKLLYKLLEKEDFCPFIFDEKSISYPFPLFCKPNIGQGSQGCNLLTNEEDLKKIKISQDLIFSEYLPGEEVTVDCFTNSEGNLIFYGPRSRRNIKSGIAFQSEILSPDAEIKKIAERLNTLIKFRGIWFFQLKKDKNNKYKLLETSCRPSTGISLYRQAGVNIPLLAAYDALGMETKILKNPDFTIKTSKQIKSLYKHNLQYNSIYIDYDDTIIIDNKPNLLAIKFLYESKIKHKKIVLLTRHESDIESSLKKNWISKNLFDEIHIIKKEQKKSSFINDDKSIFIDNLFTERMDVLKNKNIPVFDVDAIEVLIEEAS